MRIASIRAWKLRHPTLSEMLISVVLGILIEIGLLAFQPPTLLVVRRVGDDTADRMIRLAERTTDRIPKSPAFTFIDIDDATWAAWGWPVVTPRDKIEDLIARAAASDPLAIVVDVDLSFPGDPAAEESLQRYLAAYAPSAPPLLLVRSLISNGPGALPLERPTVFDAATVGKANIAWGTPLFERDGDGNVRRWRLFAPACEGERPVVLPSTHLNAAVIARRAVYGPPPGEPPTPPIERLAERLGPFVPDHCGQAAEPRQGVIDDWPKDIPITVEPADVSKRVIYRVGWQAGAIALGPTVESPSGGETQLVQVRPARTVLAAEAGASLPGLAGRIVVIGGSFADSGDWHATPIGKMPGALMIINAIEALTLNGTPREPGVAERIAISLGIIVLASLLTSIFRPSVAAWGLAFGVFVLMVVSISRFKSGVMLDLAVPAVGAVLHDLGESIVSTGRQLREQGWRWVLKVHHKPGALAAGAAERDHGGAPAQQEEVIEP